ncbi:hypothetical protein L228DRAFT_19082 [Xylona heveae TC161]|uniref:Uncharacterized protein n=1 Tax=Xylona heveae (strain CBS 132557 / TC161) TaxID=1328760 RepID=A0A165JZ16_XYLHT|nr:hypothetical protein L228DRAFT_19082 [Xylona heveae TC161]KZF26808.1 hypothetical protein L228DRAFT_19082 [Xylona heveae TC161]
MTESQSQLGVPTRAPAAAPAPATPDSTPLHSRRRTPSPSTSPLSFKIPDVGASLTSALPSFESDHHHQQQQHEQSMHGSSNGIETDNETESPMSLMAFAQTLLTPLYFISFLLSLFLIDTHRHPSSSSSSSSSPMMTTSSHKGDFWLSSSATIKKGGTGSSMSPPQSPSARSESGYAHMHKSSKDGQSWTWAWRRGDRKLIRRELVDAFDMRRMVLTAMICSVMLIMGAGAVSGWWLWRWGWGVGASA